MRLAQTPALDVPFRGRPQLRGSVAIAKRFGCAFVFGDDVEDGPLTEETYHQQRAMLAILLATCEPALASATSWPCTMTNQFGSERTSSWVARSISNRLSFFAIRASTRALVWPRAARFFVHSTLA
jgi:hypothetical protein